VLLTIIGLPMLLVLVVVVSVAVLDRTNGSIVSSGKPRSYLLYVPQSYDRASRRRSSSACTAPRDGRPSK